MGFIAEGYHIKFSWKLCLDLNSRADSILNRQFSCQPLGNSADDCYHFVCQANQLFCTDTILPQTSESTFVENN